MTTAAPTSLMFTIGLGAFIAWRMLARVRRMVGRQRASPTRPWFTVILFPVLLVLLSFVALANPAALLALAVGAVGGGVLGVVGLRLTRFESTPEGRFYTPNPYLGIALSVLLVARIGWRYLQLYGATTEAMSQRPDFSRSPLTLALFGLLAGYYTLYAAGLLRWQAGAAMPVGPAAES